MIPGEAPRGEGEARYRPRVALVSQILGALTVAVVALHTLAYDRDHELLSALFTQYGNPFNWAIAGGFLIAWLGTRGTAPRPTWLVQVLDAGSIVLGATFLAISSYEVRGLWSAPHIALLGMTNMIISRAILVPSPPKRTLAISASSAVASVVLSVLVAFDDAAVRGPLGPHVLIANTVLWAAVAVALAAIVSSVLYGLRKEVREARRLGQYELEERIGAGAMGEVFRARHALLRRPTAVKLIAGAEVTEAQMKHFEHEVQVTARLTHPNTISVYDFGRTPNGVFYYAMEYLEGLTLEELVQTYGPQPPGRIVRVLAQIASALAEAHDVGLIHRDIKPANVFLCDRGGEPDFVKVLDFGLVKDTTADDGETGVVGTPLYLSPEGIKTPDKITHSSDLYALGAVGYFLATSRPVFEGYSVLAICDAHMNKVPTPIAERTGRPFPEDLERVLMDCLAKDPAARPADARALRERLLACADAGAWTTEDARRFFAALPRRAAPSRPPVLAAIEVDVRKR